MINLIHPMYAAYLKDKFPQDDKNGLYVAPNLPAVRLGKLLIKDRRIASPNDVIALHYFSSTFSSGYVLFTEDTCYYDDGSFLLEDVKEIQLDGRKMTVFANQQAQFVPNNFSVKNEQVAQTLKRIFEGAGRYDPKAKKALEAVDYQEQGFNTAEVSWLKLRDEVMRTIDLLYDRYNDGKLSILEYEEKKEDLLKRL
ncbi:MAG: hypothetical protein AAFV07_03170 [Bacteroidota bacterium]